MLYEYRPEVYFNDEVRVEIEGDDEVRFSAPFAQFYPPVRLTNCTINRLDLYATYFLGGLEIEKCRILCDVNWQSGGHNTRPIRIIDSEFSRFVDVEDCLFQDEVVLRNVVFRKGTNLLGNVGTPMEVSFETSPNCETVEGKLDVNTYKPASTDNDQAVSEPMTDERS